MSARMILCCDGLPLHMRLIIGEEIRHNSKTNHEMMERKRVTSSSSPESWLLWFLLQGVQDMTSSIVMPMGVKQELIQTLCLSIGII